MTDIGPTPWRCTNARRDGNSARSCAAGSAASIARPLAVSVAGRRTPTSVTRLGRPAARSSITYSTSRPCSTARWPLWVRRVDEPARARCRRSSAAAPGARRPSRARTPRRRARSGAARAGGRRSPRRGAPRAGGRRSSAGSPRSRAIAAAGIGAACEPSSFRTPRAWVAAGALATRPSVSDPRHKPRELDDSARPRRVRWRHGTRRLPSTATVAGRHRPARLRRRDRGRAPRRAGRTSPTRRSARSPRAAAPSRRSPSDERPHYGVSTGFGALATRHIAPERRAALQRSLIRSHAAGIGPRGRARGRAGDDAAAPLDARDRPHRRPPATPRPPTPRCSTPASRRSCTSTARSAAPATSRRSPTARSR